MKKKIDVFFDKYINDLSKSLHKVDKKSLNKAANEVLKKIING